MGEKVKVSKIIAECIMGFKANHIFNGNYNGKQAGEKLIYEYILGKLDKEYSPLYELSVLQLGECLINGYEVEETPEERLLNDFKYNNDQYVSTRNEVYLIRNQGIQSALNTLGIKIKGINK